MYKRSFPKGQSVEILNTNFFLKKFNNIKTKYDRENVTTYFYKNSKFTKIMNIENKVSFSKVNLSVDTLEDLKKIRKIYIKTKDKNWKSYAKTYKKFYS